MITTTTTTKAPVPGGLGRVLPPNFDHVEKYPYGDVAPGAPFVLEKILPLPPWHKKHDQGEEGACVGFGTSMMLAVMHTVDCLSKGATAPYIHYNPWWLWDRAKEVDPYPESNPGDNNGTTVSAACDILRTKGHTLWVNEADPKSIGEVKSSYGIKENRWAKTIDEMRTALYNNIPLSIGINWYEDFDKPVFMNGEYWIGVNPQSLRNIRGGHCVCVFGGSDQRKAGIIKNSWGDRYPEVWMPFDTLERLIVEGGEVSLITDL